ncbi:hypothetical protein ABTM52_19720, partial [Acinetobacter baumannii]
ADRVPGLRQAQWRPPGVHRQHHAWQVVEEDQDLDRGARREFHTGEGLPVALFPHLPTQPGTPPPACPRPRGRGGLHQLHRGDSRPPGTD